MKRICLNKSVLDFMESKLTGDSTVLEFGGGYSSTWFAERCRALAVIETSRRWADIVRDELIGFDNWRLLRLDHVADFSFKGKCDLVLVDCVKEQRNAAALYGWATLNEGGWLVFDDAQRPDHAATVEWLDGQADGVELGWNKNVDLASARNRKARAYQK